MKEQRITAKQFGTKWPFIFDEAMLVKDGLKLLLRTKKRTYALNESGLRAGFLNAKSITKKNTSLAHIQNFGLAL